MGRFGHSWRGPRCTVGLYRRRRGHQQGPRPVSRGRVRTNFGRKLTEQLLEGTYISRKTIKWAVSFRIFSLSRPPTGPGPKIFRDFSRPKFSQGSAGEIFREKYFWTVKKLSVFRETRDMDAGRNYEKIGKES